MSKRMVLVMVLTMCLGAVGVGTYAAGGDGTPKKHSLGLGVVLPSGTGATENYGGAWLGARWQYCLNPGAAIEHAFGLGVTAGLKSKKFQTGSGREANSDFAARIWGIGYTLRYRPTEAFFVGAGVDANMASTEAEYDAGDGNAWYDGTGKNLGQKVSFDTSKTVFSPHIVAGANLGDRFGIELRYSMFSTSLAAPDSTYTNLPRVDDIELDSLLTLMGSLTF